MWRGWAALLSAALLLLGGCDGGKAPGSTPSASSASPDGSPQASPGDQQPTPGDEQPTPQPPDSPSPAQQTASPPAQSPADTRPVVGNIILSPDNVECAYTPNGNPDGSDSLTVFAYVLLIGANSLPGPLRTSVGFANGYSATVTGGPNNQASLAFQGPIRSGDWGRALDVALRTDPGDAYRESDESDNAIRVSVSLPAVRSAQAIDPLSCRASR